MNPSIRLARSTDLTQLPSIERSAAAAFEGTDLLDGLNSLFSPAEVWTPALAAATLWVADDAGVELAGFLAATIHADALHIDEVDVRRQSQGKGIGTRLIGAALDCARGRDLEAVTLCTFSGVPWNEPFYARLGFRRLEPAAMTERLVALLAHEATIRLDPRRRCAMRLTLKQSRR
jgi:GNAT superfamily N-acetyltransferase